LYIAELIGVFLVGYGIWFTNRGIQRALGADKDWWRPLRNRKRYPYPAAGALLGVCFACLGARFALNNVWGHAPILGYVGGGLFAVVVVVGIAQPRFLHPRWYGRLWDRYGREGMARLRRAAYELEDEKWVEIDSSEITFDRWVERVMPRFSSADRGYKQGTDSGGN
jgi:hypothetical protein